MSAACSIDGCARPRYGNQPICHTHYERKRKHGSPHVCLTRPRGAGTLANTGYIRVTGRDGLKRQAHRLIAERAIGKALPRGAVVHHVDGDRTNNAGANLVICPSNVYHHLLHQRQATLDACGHADWFKCRYCHVYSQPSEIVHRGGDNFHRECHRAASRARVAGRRP